jgi:hypothetical protein
MLIPDVMHHGYSRDAYLEVKNLRAPIGILDTFTRLHSELAANYPSLSRCMIQLTHYWDNYVREEQEACIEEFMVSLAQCPVPCSITLKLPSDVEVGIEVSLVKGTGSVCLTRGIGGDSPEGPFVDLRALEAKATDTISKAAHQLSPYKDAERVLALNISTPDAMPSSKIVELLRRLVWREGKGKMKWLLLHHNSSGWNVAGVRFGLWRCPNDRKSKVGFPSCKTTVKRDGQMV